MLLHGEIVVHRGQACRSQGLHEADDMPTQHNFTLTLITTTTQSTYLCHPTTCSRTATVAGLKVVEFLVDGKSKECLVLNRLINKKKGGNKSFPLDKFKNRKH